MQVVTDTSRLHTVHNMNGHVRYMYVQHVCEICSKNVRASKKESECKVRIQSKYTRRAAKLLEKDEEDEK